MLILLALLGAARPVAGGGGCRGGA